MNLQEYLNQTDPVKMPEVFLEDDDYIVGTSVPGYWKNSIEKTLRTQIFIKAFPGVEYVKEGSWSQLYTTDGDGNPKSLSCFKIEKLKTKEKSNGR